MVPETAHPSFDIRAGFNTRFRSENTMGLCRAEAGRRRRIPTGDTSRSPNEVAAKPSVFAVKPRVLKPAPSPFCRSCVLAAIIAASLTACARSVDPPQQIFSRLETLLESQSYKEAVSLARAHVGRYPASARLYLSLGKAEFAQGRFREAAQALERASALGWRGPVLYQFLGQAYFYLGQFQAARASLEQALLEGPDEPHLAKLLGYSHYYLGEGQEAVRYFERALKVDTNDLEAAIALEAVQDLIGPLRSAQLNWYQDRSKALTICFPSFWKQETEESLGPAGKVTTVTFVGEGPGKDSRLRVGEILVFRVVHNASRHPMPTVMEGAYRRGDPHELDSGRQWRYATTPTSQPAYGTMTRDPDRLARALSQEYLHSLVTAWDLVVKDLSVNAWSGIHGWASYCFGKAVATDRYDRAIVGYSLGIYDPSSDIFGGLVLYGPQVADREIGHLARAIFHLARSGGVQGVVPLTAPPEMTAEEWIARIQGFLQAGESNRALSSAETATHAYPNNAELKFLAGLASLGLKRLDDAASAFTLAHQLGFSTLYFELNFGEVLLGLDRADQAEVAFRRALLLKPEDPIALIGLGRAAWRQGALDEAKGWFARAAGVVPHDERIPWYLAALAPGTGESGPLQWYRPESEGLTFCYPAGWESRAEQKAEAFQVVLAQAAQLADPQEFETGLLYLRYAQASKRVGKARGRPSPEEIAQSFIVEAFREADDPGKVGLDISPVYRRGSHARAVGHYTFTKGDRRWNVRILSDYDAPRDRLHILTFRTAGLDLGEWEGFIQVCFDTAYVE